MNRLALAALLAVFVLGCPFPPPAQARDATVTWTSPADDGNRTVQQVMVRYKSVPPAADSASIASWWVNAAVVPTRAPRPAGMPDTARAAGLDAGRTWYFLAFSVDSAGNWSPPSNVAVLRALDVTRPAAIGLGVRWEP